MSERLSLSERAHLVLATREQVAQEIEALARSWEGLCRPSDVFTGLEAAARTARQLDLPASTS